MAVSGSIDSFSATTSNNNPDPAEDVTPPTITTFEYFVKLPPDIQFCMFEELIAMKGLWMSLLSTSLLPF